MCIIIDSDTFAAVFNAECAEHAEFLPVYDWILEGKGKVVLGGSEYEAQLSRCGRYLNLFFELGKKGKVVVCPTDEIDQVQEELEAMVNRKQFDDAHIAAIVQVSGCKLVCTKDSRSLRFIKDPSLYRHPVRPPRIYSRAAHQHLLCDQNIAKCCCT